MPSLSEKLDAIVTNLQNIEIPVKAISICKPTVKSPTIKTLCSPNQSDNTTLGSEITGYNEVSALIDSIRQNQSNQNISPIGKKHIIHSDYEILPFVLTNRQSLCFISIRVFYDADNYIFQNVIFPKIYTSSKVYSHIDEYISNSSSMNLSSIDWLINIEDISRNNYILNCKLHGREESIESSGIDWFWTSKDQSIRNRSPFTSFSLTDKEIHINSQTFPMKNQCVFLKKCILIFDIVSYLSVESNKAFSLNLNGKSSDLQVHISTSLFNNHFKYSNYIIEYSQCRDIKTVESFIGVSSIANVKDCDIEYNNYCDIQYKNTDSTTSVEIYHYDYLNRNNLLTNNIQINQFSSLSEIYNHFYKKPINFKIKLFINFIDSTSTDILNISSIYISMSDGKKTVNFYIDNYSENFHQNNIIITNQLSVIASITLEMTNGSHFHFENHENLSLSDLCRNPLKFSASINKVDSMKAPLSLNLHSTMIYLLNIICLIEIKKYLPVTSIYIKLKGIEEIEFGIDKMQITYSRHDESSILLFCFKLKEIDSTAVIEEMRIQTSDGVHYTYESFILSRNSTIFNKLPEIHSQNEIESNYMCKRLNLTSINGEKLNVSMHFQYNVTPAFKEMSEFTEELNKRTNTEFMKTSSFESPKILENIKTSSTLGEKTLKFDKSKNEVSSETVCKLNTSALGEKTYNINEKTPLVKDEAIHDIPLYRHDISSNGHDAFTKNSGTELMEKNTSSPQHIPDIQHNLYNNSTRLSYYEMLKNNQEYTGYSDTPQKSNLTNISLDKQKNKETIENSSESLKGKSLREVLSYTRDIVEYKISCISLIGLLPYLKLNIIDELNRNHLTWIMKISNRIITFPFNSYVEFLVYQINTISINSLKDLKGLRMTLVSRNNGEEDIVLFELKMNDQECESIIRMNILPKKPFNLHLCNVKNIKDIHTIIDWSSVFVEVTRC